MCGTHLIAYCTLMCTHTLQIFDAFTPRLTDSNVKVNLAALESFSRLVPLLGDCLSPVLPNILPALPITSKLAGVAPVAGRALQLVCQYVDSAHLVQPLVNLSQFTNPRAQPIVVSHLAGTQCWGGGGAIVCSVRVEPI